MKVSRIALAEFRKFRGAAELGDLDPGLNIIVGANEAGKSTYAAALRAAFLERYGTSTVTHLAPRGVTGARPSVEVAFEHDGHDYLLRKHFLSKARCELLVDGGRERYEGEEAEQVLATLLGFDLPKKGLSKPEHAGIPGLLWIEQGEGQLLAGPAGHADTYLRDALTGISGELASQDGDRLYEQVQADRAELLDARGKPRAAYRDAEAELARLAQQEDEQVRALTALEADVDRLARLRGEHERDEREAPWQRHEAQAVQARERLQALARLREQVARLQGDAQRAGETAALTRAQVQRDQDDAQALTALAETLAREQHQAQEQAERAQAASAALAQAEQDLAQAREHHAAQAAAEAAAQELASLSARVRDADADIARLRQAVSQAEAAQTAAEAARNACEREARFEAPRLQALRRAEQELDRLRVQQKAVATRLSFSLSVPGIQIEGEPLAGEGDRLLTAAARVDIPGVGWLRIEPGGRDLQALASDLVQAQGMQQQLLHELNVASLAQAEEAWLRRTAAERDMSDAQKALVIHAPQGLEALRRELQGRQQTLARDQERLAALQAQQSGGLPAARAGMATLAQAQERYQHLAQQSRQAQAAHDTAAARAQVLGEDLRTRRAAFDAPEESARRAARGEAWLAARTAQEALARDHAQQAQALEAERPELAEQDLARFTRSAEVARRQHADRQAELLQLQGRLQQANAQGMGEQLALTRAERERWTRRRDELRERAQALDLLANLLQSARQQTTQRLLAPLSQRLERYLDLLLPGARIAFDAQLQPVALSRGLDEDLASLSFGTREQLGLLARFAYADLLQEAGRPTLLVLDDALVHADDARRDLMKRVLFDVATRHQVLLFTCHGRAWEDMGVPQRQLP
ncbi:AAA family ATPase [Pseudomonadota bacterium AL_CKDN230030165-1A_HGKHYDSX7]